MIQIEEGRLLAMIREAVREELRNRPALPKYLSAAQIGAMIGLKSKSAALARLDKWEATYGIEHIQMNTRGRIQKKYLRTAIMKLFDDSREGKVVL